MYLKPVFTPWLSAMLRESIFTPMASMSTNQSMSKASGTTLSSSRISWSMMFRSSRRSICRPACDEQRKTLSGMKSRSKKPLIIKNGGRVPSRPSLRSNHICFRRAMTGKAAYWACFFANSRKCLRSFRGICHSIGYSCGR